MLLRIARTVDLEERPGVRGMGGGELDQEPMANAESDTAEKCWQMSALVGLEQKDAKRKECVRTHSPQ